MDHHKSKCGFTGCPGSQAWHITAVDHWLRVLPQILWYLTDCQDKSDLWYQRLEDVDSIMNKLARHCPYATSKQQHWCQTCRETLEEIHQDPDNHARELVDLTQLEAAHPELFRPTDAL